MKRVKLIFAWFDIWVGLYWDRDKRHLYVFPVPMFGLRLDFRPSPAGCPDCPPLRPLGDAWDEAHVWSVLGPPTLHRGGCKWRETA